MLMWLIVRHGRAASPAATSLYALPALHTTRNHSARTIASASSSTSLSQAIWLSCSTVGISVTSMPSGKDRVRR